MKLRRIKIGPIETENNVFLAPLAGYTNYPCLLYTSDAADE